MKAGKVVSIWFFIGIALFIDGVLIFASGVYEVVHPPIHPVVLANLHAGVWWGAILAVAGLFLCLYRTRDEGSSERESDGTAHD